MNQQDHIIATEEYIRLKFTAEGSGHDWWHIDRVRKLALKIAENEKADPYLVEMIALLHDLDDWKISESEEELKNTRKWLASLQIEKNQIDGICEMIEQISYKGAGVKTKPDILEAQIVQDADRLDAIGAIGIARAFAFGGNKNRLLHDPVSEPEFHANFEEYKSAKGTTINHFYEKLLLLKDMMNTNSAKAIAAGRHLFMEHYMQQFFQEWEAIE